MTKKLTRNQFIGAIVTKLVEAETMFYLVAETRVCRYGQNYSVTAGTLQELKERFADFYYPIYLEDIQKEGEENDGRNTF